jgi:hypothetical protein
MTGAQSRSLKVGQRVAWLDSKTDLGTVETVDWSGVLIAWATGKEQFFHHNNMDEVQAAPRYAMKFVIDSQPFANPVAAARKLLDIVRGSVAESKLPYAYTGATNTTFTQAGGSIEEYSVGVKHAAAQNWFEVDRSGTRIVLLADSAE